MGISEQFDFRNIQGYGIIRCAVKNAISANNEVAARFAASRYSSLMDLTSVNGASAAPQDFQALPHILRPWG